MKTPLPIDYNNVDMDQYINQSVTLDAMSSEYVAMQHPILDMDKASMREERIRRFLND